jgi:CCR4-NOT complex subunit CAF16
VDVRGLNFSYQTDLITKVQVLFGIDFQLRKGSRCVLLGENGAGKSSLLRVLAGKHLVENCTCKVLGVSSFSHTLGLSGIAFLGDNWTRTMAFAGNMSYQADIPVCEMMLSTQKQYPERVARLLELLAIDPEWRLHRVSDGQRRRVQLFLGLIRPYKVLLIDEMTVDLDVLARKDFLDFLKQESEELGVTIVYATHIFDAMDTWPTHVAEMDGGKVLKVVNTNTLETSLYNYAVQFLSEMRAARRVREEAQAKYNSEHPKDKKDVEPFSMPRNGYTAGRLLAGLAD